MGDYRPSFESKSKSDRVKKVVFSPDGKLVASESYDHRIRLWDSETGQCCFDYEGEKLSFSSDGQLLMSCSKDVVRILDVRTRSYHCFSKGHLSVLSPDGQLVASASSDHSIQLWNAHNGDSVLTFKGCVNLDINRLIFSPTGNLIVSVWKDGGVQV